MRLRIAAGSLPQAAATELEGRYRTAPVLADRQVTEGDCIRLDDLKGALGLRPSVSGRPRHAPARRRSFQDCAIAGRFFPKPVACSNAWAICSTPRSSRYRPTIWMPTGRPSGVKPAGTDAAGRNVVVIQ